MKELTNFGDEETRKNGGNSNSERPCGDSLAPRPRFFLHVGGRLQGVHDVLLPFEHCPHFSNSAVSIALTISWTSDERSPLRDCCIRHWTKGARPQRHFDVLCETFPRKASL